MLSYYTSHPNIKTIRVKPICSTELVWEIENLYTFQKSSASIEGYTYNEYQSLLEFEAIIPNPQVGEQYRATISDGVSIVWNGSIEVFVSQSVVKSEYKNQIPLEDKFISNVTNNEYIILE